MCWRSSCSDEAANCFESNELTYVDGTSNCRGTVLVTETIKIDVDTRHFISLVIDDTKSTSILSPLLISYSTSPSSEISNFYFNFFPKIEQADDLFNLYSSLNKGGLARM